MVNDCASLSYWNGSSWVNLTTNVSNTPAGTYDVVSLHSVDGYAGHARLRKTRRKTRKKKVINPYNNKNNKKRMIRLNVDGENELTNTKKSDILKSKIERMM